MTKLFKAIDRKAGEMSQERFNTWGYIILGVIIFTMFSWSVFAQMDVTKEQERPGNQLVTVVEE
ncbi:hypothetical protein D3C74_50490 [compost metagenome]